MKYCVSAGIFMKKQRSLVEYKSIQSEGWEESFLILRPHPVCPSNRHGQKALMALNKETSILNSRTPLNLRYKDELSWS